MQINCNSCHSLAQKQLLQLSNAIQNQPDSLLLHYNPKDSVDVHNAHPVSFKESPKLKIPVTPESVNNFLEDICLEFCKYDKFKCVQRRIIDP